jgi:phosphopantothenoylcysteine decarboxylase/phosphopantothenate--cysteine ligase
VIVGFAAEDGEGALDYARGKLERKGLDAVVVNDIARPGIGFDAAENEVTILTVDGGEREVARTSKEAVAAAVLDEVQRLVSPRAQPKEATGGTTGAGARSAARV